MKKLIINIFAVLIFSISLEIFSYNFFNQLISFEITCTENNPNELLEEHNDFSEFILPETNQNFKIQFSSEPQLINCCFIPLKSSTYIWQPPEVI